MWLLFWLACSTSPGDSAPDFLYPLDDTLRFTDLQALGTHNSYHMETEGVSIPEWAYTHLPLDEQAAEQGVRQFELDLWWSQDADSFDVYHVPILDQTSNCASWTECLEAQKAWSDAHPAHHPVLTLVEMKDEAPSDPEDAAEMLETLERELCAVWPQGRLIRPDDLQGDAETLRDAVAERGWPTLGELRGRALYVLHTGSAWREAYIGAEGDSRGRALFPDGEGDPEAPWAAVHTVNDPEESLEHIQSLVGMGHLVRTRADSDSAEPSAGDTSRLEAALASGAHFVSTDYPAPREGVDYVASIPGGTPSRCNPLSAPSECTSAAIEDPAWME